MRIEDAGPGPERDERRMPERDARLMPMRHCGPYLCFLTTQDCTPMLRHEPQRDQTISDRELGIAAMLLLIVVVLTVAIVPTLL